MKNTLKLCMISLLILTGIAALSCSAGEFLGTFDEGNLNIIDIPTEHNNKYCEVSATGGGLTLTFDPASPRKQISGRAVKAPLYLNLVEGPQPYTGNETFTVTVTVYDTDGTTVLITKTLNEVKFYSGSALKSWN